METKQHEKFGEVLTSAEGLADLCLWVEMTIFDDLKYVGDPCEIAGMTEEELARFLEEKKIELAQNFDDEDDIRRLIELTERFWKAHKNFDENLEKLRKEVEKIKKKYKDWLVIEYEDEPEGSDIIKDKILIKNVETGEEKEIYIVFWWKSDSERDYFEPDIYIEDKER